MGSEDVPTIGSVARATGVSRSTVSRAFGAPHLLRSETVASVRAAAERLGYVPNPAARVLSTGRSGNLGLVVPDIINPFFATLMRGAQAKAREAGFVLFLGDADETPELEGELLSKLRPQVDGFILVAPRCPEDRIREASRRRPLVTVNSDVRGLNRVLVDTASSYAQAVERLATLGHRRLAYVAGPELSWSNLQRREAVERAARRRGMRLVVLATDRPSFEAGQRSALPIGESRTTAVLAFDDTVAQGLVAGLTQLGLSVPRDVSVVGCDGVIATTTFPALTSVDAQCRRAGEAAVELLVDVLRGSGREDRRIIVPTELVVRASTAPVPEPRAPADAPPHARERNVTHCTSEASR